MFQLKNEREGKLSEYYSFGDVRFIGTNLVIKFVENKDNQILIIDSNKNYFPKLTCCVNTY